VARKSSVDETLLHSTLRLTPAERLQRLEAFYEAARPSAPPESRPAVSALPDFRPTELLSAPAAGEAAFTQGLDITYAPDERLQRELG
jgi:hypothetical protein